MQFPLMAGNAGEGVIKDVCKVLSNTETKVNSSCGFHLHISIDDWQKMDTGEYYPNDPKTQILKDIFMFYLCFENVIMSFLPKTRRTNSFCRPLANCYHLTEIAEARNSEQIDEIWYRANGENLKNQKAEKKHGSRYRGINMHTLLSENHLEIRYHSGTTNSKKILEWTNLHLQIIDWLVAGSGYSNWRNSLELVDLGEKTDYFFRLIGLTKESEDYFRTRQMKFMGKSNYQIQASTYDTTSNMLEVEVEA